ncbi:hypothetical protein BGZ80_003382 [Entomortierella chlamydospora]|uniref:UspA domain-containing protein n=1 Tax=Entomortierella chlamydospora TaxID=101097 RepID=A0A9P6MP22_9FUNG|nr:hypothetical protein BGZ79_007631 [Entomortierella chlamydospora]KAG0008492.1 hypothetical protein BGZ80_003382 [Entomortierella chlamydospora]
MATNTSQNSAISSPSPTPPMTVSSTVSAPTSPTPSSSTASSVTTITASDINPTSVPRKTQAPPKQRSKNGYIARVGFDTLDCEDTAQYAFTLQSRTDKWRRTKKSRTFLVGTDLNEYSSHALSWVMENMIEDGDEIVALRVVPIELRDSFAKSGIPSFQGQEIAARTEAARIMEMIRQKNKSKEINIIVECRVGNVRDTIQSMIQMYEPSMLVVGTKGRSSIKGFLLGSVSRYCLNHSPVPVTVVRPASQLIKSKTKAKGIFRRRISLPLDPEEVDTLPQMFYSSPLSRQTSRASVDSEESRVAMAAMAELERKESRNSDSGHYYHHQYETAAAKASAAKRSLFSPPQTPSSMMPPDPLASINSSLSLASALLSDNPPVERKFVPPPEGMIGLTKSLTTDGTTGQYSSGYAGKGSSRLSFAKLSPSIWGLGSRRKQESREA